MADYINSDEFASGIVDSTLDTIRDQDEANTSQQLDGSVSVSAGSFRMGDRMGKHYTCPVKFSKRFQGIPRVRFGQTSQIAGAVNFDTSTFSASNFIPFLVQPYVLSWRWENGEVDGFLLGMYAITTPPDESSSNLVVDWDATGNASRYDEQGLDQSWTDSYDYNDADFLVDESTEDYS